MFSLPETVHKAIIEVEVLTRVSKNNKVCGEHCVIQINVLRRDVSPKPLTFNNKPCDHVHSPAVYFISTVIFTATLICIQQSSDKHRTRRLRAHFLFYYFY